MLGLCAPWLDEVTICEPPGATADQIARATEVASELMFAASGRKFTGLCTDTVRPCPPGAGSQWLAYPDALALPARPLPGPGWYNGLSCGCAGDWIGCGCQGHPAVALPHTPVVAVTEIMVDGAALPDPVSDHVVIIDSKWLLRRDSQPWPCCQNLAEPATEPGTWSITYTYGTAVPAAGVLAAEVLACELLLGWTSDPGCRLPKRLTNITREGITATFLDSFQFLNDGRFGIYEIDTFLAAVNPDGLQRSARIIDPYKRASRPRRVR